MGLKKIVLIVAIIGILLHNFSKFMIVACFEANRANIAKNLCVKRNETGNSCQGKCHLKKQLDNENKKSNDLSSFKISSEVQFVEKQHLVEFRLVQLSSFGFVPFNQDIQIQHHFSFFHPPQQIG